MTRSTDDFRRETGVAIEAAAQAVEVVCRGIGVDQLTLKAPRDPVTATDLAVEDAMRGMLGERLGMPVADEERVGQAPVDGSSYWLVDPICGTRNFASGIPLWCVNLARVDDGHAALPSSVIARLAS
jgi:fructose-1,6-bisphosphatase/inositol monophosphatase family enzyme